MKSDGQLHLSDCSSTDDKIGLMCLEGFGLLAAKACQVSESFISASFEGPGQVTLTDTRIDKSQSTVTGTGACSDLAQVRQESVLYTGVWASGKGLKLAMVRCVVATTGSSSLELRDSATASLDGCTFSGAQNHGVTVEGRGTEVHMDRFVMERNRVAGVHCMEGALVHAKQCHTANNEAVTEGNCSWPCAPA